MSLARTRSPSQAVLVAPASPSSRQTAGAALLQYLPPAAEALSGPYADLAAEASPPLTTTDDFSVFGPLRCAPVP